MKRVVILLNMGGPNSLDEVSVFLKNMFNDPCILGIKSKILRSFVAWMITTSRKKASAEIYKALGGKSPINDITDSLCKKATNFSNTEFDFAMRYTPPFAKDQLAKYKSYDEIVLVPLYPHYSITTIHSSMLDAKEALKDFKGKVREISYFYDKREYNEIVLNLIKEKISALSKDEIAKTSLILSAHSLPEKIITKGDPYKNHLEEHAKILKELIIENGINFKEVLLTYQSKLGPVKWVEPFTDITLKNLESKRALLFPIAFCIDNSETDYELSIEYKELAKGLNFEYFDVCKCPNDSDEFAKFLINLAGI
ncbi:ferrochelatase [Campylobacter corcagiensis]|uniref:Ferrochelatase n=1 Tax=Campylobacter corcagiensis TaxID=1448857 RepID=A0A7M1LE23_9BACT|nr:ferrochelatase [Campylobacter corcagiensis]QKF65019.1 ferrochelatase [Campylobacter corcagiensis]QOQ86827.1 ferrochelatase [Campylobacter corcagiensis]